jgi:steroid delta-isomerase-like uncharacterized protein
VGREIVEAVVRALEAEDADALVELYADDAVLHHPLSPAPLRGSAAIRASEQELFDAFSDVSVEIARVLAEDNDVAAEVVVRATHRETGRRIEMPSVWVFGLGADGKIVEERDYLDTASFLRQVGA